MAKPTFCKINSALKDPPEELDSVYDQTVERIKNQDPEFTALAIKLIYWTHFAARPTRNKVHELRHAVAAAPGDMSFDEEGRPDEDLVESTCARVLSVRGRHGWLGSLHCARFSNDIRVFRVRLVETIKEVYIIARIDKMRRSYLRVGARSAAGPMIARALPSATVIPGTPQPLISMTLPSSVASGFSSLIGDSWDCL